VTTFGVGLVLDGIVVLLLVGLALRLLTTRDLFEAIVLFIAYGLTLALAWVRLGAPDLALAEAALGAGVTGALFLNAYHRLAKGVEGGEEARPGDPFVFDDGEGDAGPWVRSLLGMGVAAVAGGVGWAVLDGVDRYPLLPELVAQALPDTGVSNPVTGVLLSFRAYDTLLEIAVLVAAMVAVWSLDRGGQGFGRDPEDVEVQPVLHGLTRIVVPLAGVVAVYLTWIGSYGPGGAFQAGALLAGAGVLLTAAGILRPPTAAAPATRAAVAIGLFWMIFVGAAVMPWTGTFLAYPAGWSYPLIVAIEAVLTLSIAVVLVELFVDVTAIPDADPHLARVDPTGDPLGRLLDPVAEPLPDPEAGIGAGTETGTEAEPR
jgi:multisubunit Na+/H+ antiporter MnhB subunit